MAFVIARVVPQEPLPPPSLWRRRDLWWWVLMPIAWLLLLVVVAALGGGDGWVLATAAVLSPLSSGLGAHQGQRWRERDAKRRLRPPFVESIFCAAGEGPLGPDVAELLVSDACAAAGRSPVLLDAESLASIADIPSAPERIIEAGKAARGTNAVALLKEHWTTPTKIDELFKLGNLYTLGSTAESDTYAFHRDLGEAWTTNAPVRHPSVANFKSMPPLIGGARLWFLYDGERWWWKDGRGMNDSLAARRQPWQEIGRE